MRAGDAFGGSWDGGAQETAPTELQVGCNAVIPLVPYISGQPIIGRVPWCRARGESKRRQPPATPGS
eukprot:3106272-Alexandrium_andersonii.AAC.1